MHRRSGLVANTTFGIRNREPRHRRLSEFYKNRELENFASKEVHRLTLRQLMFYGKTLNEQRLIVGANYLRTALPIRIAHRLRDMQALPYIVVTQQSLAKVYEVYWSAFNKLRLYPKISSIAENKAFCDFLSSLLQDHKTVIPNLSLGLSMSSHHLAPEFMDSFIRRMMTSRISRRVLAEHHIALSSDFDTAGVCNNPIVSEERIGIIFGGLNVKRIVEKCVRLLGATSDVVIEGHTGTTFTYIKEHIEYIIFEILKNSFMAISRNPINSSTKPYIRVTIVNAEDDVAIRISDAGGGLDLPVVSSSPMTMMQDMFSFSHTRNGSRLDGTRLSALKDISLAGVEGTVEEQIAKWENVVDPLGKLQASRIGIGLPMSNIFATYFGGSLELISLDGWGTDTYLRLPKLGKNLEGIEV